MTGAQGPGSTEALIQGVLQEIRERGIRAVMVDTGGVGDQDVAQLVEERGADPATNAHRKLINELSARHRLPTIHAVRGGARDGGLISYGVNLPDVFRQAAAYADRILKGDKPADLPVQLSTKFELAINLKTATALGLTVPHTLLMSADELIDCKRRCLHTLQGPT